MLHFGLFDIRTDVFVLLVFFFVVLLQAFLCFKAKKKIVRLLPVCLTLVLTIVFIALGLIFDGWDAIGFFLLAIFSAVLLMGSGIAWGAWAIVRKNKKIEFDEANGGQ